MTTILITGSEGFVGRNLRLTLGQIEGMRVLGFDVGDSLEVLSERVLEADFIFHLAGVNRPENPGEFQAGNVDLTQALVRILLESGRQIPLLFASSTQALLDNPYGRSKRAAEDVVLSYGTGFGAPVFVYRLPNVFGKWCRPNYNSAVATFCHNIGRDLPIRIDDPATPLTLVYIDDLIDEFLRAMEGQPTREGVYCVPAVTHEATVGEVVDLIRSFRDSRVSIACPDMGSPLTRKLYSTYLSNLPEDSFGYPLRMHSDSRGSFTEFLRTPERGQVSVNISKPGITKGNHWHHTKNEKFVVVSGKGVVRFRRLGDSRVLEYPVTGEHLMVVDIPPGYTHAITNLGEADMVTIMWVNEPFDPAKPDTWFEKV